MQNKIYFSLTILLLALLSSCQSSTSDTPDTKSYTVYTDYFVRYLAEEGELKGVASFLRGDTVTKVTPLKFKNGVSFHGSAMKGKNIQNKVYRYVQIRQADYSETFKFKHTYEGEDVKHEIKMSPIEDFYLKGKASRETGMEVVVVGRGLEEGESYVFLVSDQNNKAISYTAQRAGSKMKMTVPASEIAKLVSGIGQLYIVKKQLKFEKQNGYDIRAEIEYYSKPIVIDIE